MQSKFKSRLGAKSILIIEDDETLSEAFAECLNLAGYVTLAANNVNDAVKKLENQKFHLVIVDFFLGDQTGEKIISLIRKDLCGLNLRTPIVVCSGYLNSNIFDNIRQYVDDVIIKPFDLSFLVQKANHWTEQLSKKDTPKMRIVSDSKPKILVVDDDVDLNDGICQYLNELKYTTVPSYNIIDTKVKLSRQKFDFILMDRHIKHRECTEIVKSLETDVNSPNYKTPVVVMTGDLSDEFINFIRNNVHGFIRKPITLIQIPEMINSVLRI